MRAASASVLVLAALSACRGGGGGSPPAPSASASAQPAPVAKPSRGPRTTDGAIATRNLDAQIRAAEQIAAAQPAAIKRKEKLVSLLVDRGTFLGRFADLERVLDLAEGIVKAAPDDPRAYVIRAGARAALHRFSEALADLDKAAALGAKPATLDERRAGIFEAVGRFDDVLPLRRKAREAWPNIATLGAEAKLLGEMGQRAEAARMFTEGLEKYRDVSPFPVVWLLFQEGTMWERAGELDRARECYADANARLPLYAHAAAHLAALVPPDRAVKILEPIVESSDDPQYEAQLAEAMRLSHATGWEAHLEKARARFEALEKRHPAAVADHAGWFWLGPGNDAARALSLAKANVKERPTAPAYELLIEAAVRANRKDEACAAAEQALSLRYPIPKLLDAAARAFEACGKPERASEAKQRAEALSKTL